MHVSDFAVLNALVQFLQCRAWRDIRPTPHFSFFASACFASSNIRRLVGPSAVTGFSMKTFRPFSIAYLKCTQRNASGVVKITMSPGFSESIAFL